MIDNNFMCESNLFLKSICQNVEVRNELIDFIDVQLHIPNAQNKSILSTLVCVLVVSSQ